MSAAINPFPLLATLGAQSPWLLGGWIVLLVVLLLAGAVLNLLGLAGNWGMLLSMFGGMAGSVFGMSIGTALISLPGALAGIILGGGVGALLGAMLGELWKGSDAERRIQVGRGAFWGRILGTLAKTMIGTLMFLLALAGLIF